MTATCDAQERASATHRPKPLSAREREVLRLLCQRLTDPEIAAALGIGTRTAESHVGSILHKLAVANRREAATLAARYGLLWGGARRGTAGMPSRSAPGSRGVTMSSYLAVHERS